MRLLFLLTAAVAVAAPAQQRDWSAVATKTPAGAYVIGNPQAKVKLIEYASYTCSHCARFAQDSKPALDPMIRAGKVSLEFRHYVLNGFDLAAAVLARCTGPRFAATTAHIFATQGQWLPRGAQWLPANQARIAALPAPAQLRAMADGAGLTAAMIARGLAPARVDACFADTAEVTRIAAMRDAAPAGIHSTPTFLLNGKQYDHIGWAGLEPHLRAAGAR